MKLILAPDSFKGSLSSTQAIRLLTQAAKKVFREDKELEIHGVPMADGGEGTVDALLFLFGGKRIAVEVEGPVAGFYTCAEYAMLADGRTAVLEMAQASGLPLAEEAGRKTGREFDLPSRSSGGTGEMIADALRRGARNFLLGIGGSATNDGGIGMLEALGVRFLDEEERALPGCGASLKRIRKIDCEGMLPELKECSFTIICDVTNPLLGPTGATYVYGPQKGGGPDILDDLEAGMSNYARVLEAALGKSVARLPGSGAAGGMGAALRGVLDAKLRRGIDVMLELAHFDELLENADVAVTGEGNLDGQTVAFGKVAGGIRERCLEHGVPVIAIAGGMGEGAADFYESRASVMTSVSRPMSLNTAMEETERLFADAAERMFRMVHIGMEIAKKERTR